MLRNAHFPYNCSVAFTRYWLHNRSQTRAHCQCAPTRMIVRRGWSVTRLPPGKFTICGVQRMPLLTAKKQAQSPYPSLRTAMWLYLLVLIGSAGVKIAMAEVDSALPRLLIALFIVVI